MRATLLITSLLLCGCALATPQRGIDLALYSWKPHGEDWHFAMLPQKTTPPSTEGAITSSPAIIGLAALRQRIAALPAGSRLAWRTYPPRDYVTYPPARARDDVISFAQQHRIPIFVIPTIYE